MTPSHGTSHRLRHGQALALQYAAQALINLDRNPSLVPRVLSPGQLNAENAVETGRLGCTYAARILLPFVVELGLKALVAKHNNDQAKPTHHLCELHDALPPELRNALSDDFERIKFSETPTETRSLRQILIDHDNDFADWRYLDDAGSLVATPILTLQYVASSVLNVYNDG